MKEIAKLAINLTEKYPYRYTIDFYIQKKRIEANISVNKIDQELANLTGVSTRTIKRYQYQKKGLTFHFVHTHSWVERYVD